MRRHIKGAAGTRPWHTQTPFSSVNSTWEHFLQDKRHAPPTCATAPDQHLLLCCVTHPHSQRQPQHLPTAAQQYNSTHTTATAASQDARRKQTLSHRCRHTLKGIKRALACFRHSLPQSLRLRPAGQHPWPCQTWTAGAATAAAGARLAAAAAAAPGRAGLLHCP